MNLPSFRTGCALVIACALLARAGAQTSNWIAPLGDTYALWTDSSNWDNGVPNSPDAIANIPAMPARSALIAGTSISLRELRFANGYPKNIYVGSGALSGTLAVKGSGIFSPPNAGYTVWVANGSLEIQNSATISASLLAGPDTGYLGGSSSIRFSDSSIFSGVLNIGTGRGGATVTFADHTLIDGGSIQAYALGGTTTVFRDDTAVSDGSISSSWGLHRIIVSERANVSGLSLRTSSLGTAGGYLLLDIDSAYRPVAIRSINGDVGVSLGYNTLIFASVPETGSQIDGSISGTGGLRFESTNRGTVRITNSLNSYTGQTYIGSTVELLGGRLNAVRITEGGRLNVIAGSVNNSLSIEQGVVSLLGTSPLVIFGNYAQSTAGVLSLPISDTVSLIITGSANLGGQLIAISPPRVALGTQRFPVLVAGSITGRFASAAGLGADTAMVKRRLDYATDNVALIVEQQRFAEVSGATPATAALGRQIDLGLDTASGGYRDWIVALNRLATSAEVTASLANAAPDRLSVLAEEGFAQAAARVNLLRQQLRADDAVFFSGLRRERTAEPKRSLPRTQSVTNGGIAGATCSRGLVRFGAFVAREHTSFELDEQGSRATDSSTTPGLAFHFNHQDYFAEGVVAVTVHHYRWQRLVAAGYADAVATGVSRGREWDWALGAGRVFRLGRWEFVPAIGLLGSQWQMNDNTESSVGALAYEFARWENRSLRSRLDCEISYTKPAARWRPHLGLQWWHEFEPRRAIRGRMIASGGDYYLAPGRRGELDEAQVRTGLDWQVARSVTASAEATFSAGRTIRHADSYSGSVRWQF